MILRKKNSRSSAIFEKNNIRKNKLHREFRLSRLTYLSLVLNTWPYKIDTLIALSNIYAYTYFIDRLRNDKALNDVSVIFIDDI